MSKMVAVRVLVQINEADGDESIVRISDSRLFDVSELTLMKVRLETAALLKVSPMFEALEKDTAKALALKCVEG